MELLEKQALEENLCWAVHEAGHVCMGRALGHCLGEVTLKVAFVGSGGGKDMLAVIVAGVAAELELGCNEDPSFHRGGDDPNEPASDFGQIARILRTDAPPFLEMAELARPFFAMPATRYSFMRFAQRLVKYGSLSGREAGYAADYFLRYDRAGAGLTELAVQIQRQLERQFV